MLPVNNLINQIFVSSYQWDVYNQRFSSSIPVDRVTGPGQTQIGYWSDSQLWQTLAWARFAYERNPILKGIVNILIDHIGKPHVEWIGDRKLARKLSKMWEKFTRVNCLGDSTYLTLGELSQDREREIRLRWLRDGEVFIRFFVKDIGYPLVLRFVEPEQVRTPPVDRDEKFSHTWGIVTDIDDNENIRGYWVYYPNQREWDYVHRRYMVYGRRNADRNIKRGLPEIANIELDAAHLWQILRSVAITSKAQASIAWVEKYPGALLEQILAHSMSTRDTSGTSFGPFKPGAPNPFPSFYGIDPNTKNIDAGTVLSVNQGKEYEPGPTSDPQKYIDACASILHLLSLQWCLPDWITKGPEAYASALVSGSPFVRRIESMQADYVGIFGQVCTTFVKLAERLGWLDRGTLNKVQPVVRLPSVIMADEAKQVDTLHKELQSGLLSEIEYLHKRGRDPRKTLAQRKKWRELLEKYKLDNEQQGFGENIEDTKADKTRDYLSPPGSRILMEDRCQKADVSVTNKLTGKCETVRRCIDWEPSDESSYIKGCQQIDHSNNLDTSGAKEANKIRSDIDRHIEKTMKAMENKYIQMLSVTDHNERQGLMGEIASLSSSVIAHGYLKELTSYPVPVKRWVMGQIAKSIEGSNKGKKKKLTKLFLTKEVEKAQTDAELNKLISKAVKKLKSKSGGAATPVLDMIAEVAIDSLSRSIKEGTPIAIEGDKDSTQTVRYAMSKMDFTPKNIVDFLGGAMTMASIDDQIDEHQKAMLRSSVLKTLAGKIPYLESVEVSKSLSNFAFESFVAVNEKTYATIMSNVGKILDKNTAASELMDTLGVILDNCPSVYGQLQANEEEKNKFLNSIVSIQDDKVKKEVMESIILRCIFSYGTAEIARRGNEEAWARIHGAGMAYNPQFPGIDNIVTKMNKDGTYSIIPMSHKMHMTEGSNSPEKEFGHMTTIVELISDNFERKPKGKYPQGKWFIREKVENILGNVLVIDKPQARRIALNNHIKELEKELRANGCDKVDWSKDTGNREECFKLDYTKMILSSLSRHIKNMSKDDIKKISYQPITLVRFRPDRIEFYKGIENKEGNKLRLIPKEAGTYHRKGYESRMRMVVGALKVFE